MINQLQRCVKLGRPRIWIPVFLTRSTRVNYFGYRGVYCKLFL